MRAQLASLGVLVAAIVSTGCAGQRHVGLLAAAGVPLTSTPTGAIPLEVVTRGTAVPDPLPVRGSGVVYGDVEATLGMAVSSAAVPWADDHKKQRPDGWQLFVELIHADAERDGQRLIITLDTRATLRGRAGMQYLAQTQASCRQSGLVAPEDGGHVVYACMQRIGRDLTSWLAAVQP